MKIRSIFSSSALAFAMFFAPPVFAQSEEEPSEQKTVASNKTAAETAKPALWKIADEDTTIYLFGTIHLLPDTVNWYSGRIKQALDSSGTLVTEIDMTPEKLAAVGPLMAKLGTLPEGETLRGLMTDEQRARYESGLEKLGAPLNAFDTLEPWFAAIALTQVIAQASGFTQDKGVETVLETKIESNVKRDALETVESQLAAFDEMPIDAQLDFLLQGAEDPAAAIEVLNSLVDLWAKGDVDQLSDLMDDSFKANPILEERLLDNRNQNWAEWIDTRLDEPGTVFIAAGALHFAGESSVQTYLAKRGIETTRLQ